VVSISDVVRLAREYGIELDTAERLALLPPAPEEPTG
jgi:hypothetical protein